VATVGLSFLNRRAERHACRICREIAELKTERLCAVCARIKVQIRSRFPEAARGGMPTLAQQCKRSACPCEACGVRTLDAHPFYPSDPRRPDRREVHLHPRCHELWVETVTGVVARTDQVVDVGQG